MGLKPLLDGSRIVNEDDFDTGVRRYDLDLLTETHVDVQYYRACGTIRHSLTNIHDNGLRGILVPICCPYWDT